MSCNADFLQPQVDLTTTPGWTIGTSQAAAGDIYTFGWPLRDPGDADQRLRAVEIVESHGLEIVGVGSNALDGGSIGITDGWPPEGYDVEFISPAHPLPLAHARVEAVIGIRALEPQSGLRGLRLTYENGGVRVTELVDMAFFACPQDCGDADDVLSELGLLLR